MRGRFMSINSGLLRLSLTRILMSAAVAAAVMSSAAFAADAPGSIFLEPLQQIFAAQPVSTLEEPEATKFTVTPANYDVAANSTGNTFVWTFTADNSAGGNANPLTFT